MLVNVKHFKATQWPVLLDQIICLRVPVTRTREGRNLDPEVLQIEPLDHAKTILLTEVEKLPFEFSYLKV